MYWGGTSYGYYENHGHVRTKGYNLSLLYSFSHWFDVGGTFNCIDTRDYESTWQAPLCRKVCITRCVCRISLIVTPI